MILHTSGSSGQGKAAIISYEALAWGYKTRRELCKIQPDERWLITLSLSFAAGLGHAMPVLYSGGCIVSCPLSRDCRLGDRGD